MKKRKDGNKQRDMVITVALKGKFVYQAVGMGSISLGRFESHRRAQIAALINRHFHALGYENVPRTMEAI